MEISTSRIDNINIISVKSRIILGESAKDFSQVLAQTLSRDDGHVLIDLSCVDEVDSTGLGELVGYMVKFANEHRHFAVLKPTEKIARLFEMSNLQRAISLFSDVATAVSSLKNGSCASVESLNR